MCDKRTLAIVGEVKLGIIVIRAVYAPNSFIKSRYFNRSDKMESTSGVAVDVRAH